MCKAYPARAAPINELNVDRQYNYDVTEATDVNISDDPDLFVGILMNTNNKEEDLWCVTETIGGVPVKFKLDTGSQANLIPRAIFDHIKGLTLTSPTGGLVTYT